MAMWQPAFSVLRHGGEDFDKLVKIACWQNSLMNSALFPLPESREYRLETARDLEVQSADHSLSCSGLVTG